MLRDAIKTSNIDVLKATTVRTIAYVISENHIIQSNFYIFYLFFQITQLPQRDHFLHCDSITNIAVPCQIAGLTILHTST